MKKIVISIFCFLTIILIHAQDNILIRGEQYCPVRDTLIDGHFSPKKRLPEIMKLLNGLITKNDTLLNKSNLYSFSECIDKLNHGFDTKVFSQVSYFALSCYEYREDISYLIKTDDGHVPIFSHMTYIFELGFQDLYLNKALEIINKNKEKVFLNILYNIPFNFFKKGNSIYFLIIVVPEGKIYLPFVKKVEKYLIACPD